MESGKDPRDDKSGNTRQPSPPSNSEPSKAPGGVGTGTRNDPAKAPGAGAGGNESSDKRG